MPFSVGLIDTTAPVLNRSRVNWRNCGSLPSSVAMIIRAVASASSGVDGPPGTELMNASAKTRGVVAWSSVKYCRRSWTTLRTMSIEVIPKLCKEDVLIDHAGTTSVEKGECCSRWRVQTRPSSSRYRMMTRDSASSGARPQCRPLLQAPQRPDTPSCASKQATPSRPSRHPH